MTKSPWIYLVSASLIPALNHQSYYTFKARYVVTRKIEVHGRSVEIVVGYRNLSELTDIIKPFSKEY